MNDPVITYLHDHHAGSNFAIELLERLRERYQGHETGFFATTLLADIEADRNVLESIIERTGKGHFDIKDAIGWLGEKASRIKLQDNQPTGFGTFEAIEALALGIVGKQKLWQALSVAAESDPRFKGWDFDLSRFAPKNNTIGLRSIAWRWFRRHSELLHKPLYGFRVVRSARATSIDAPGSKGDWCANSVGRV